jgi:SAM-dependent methyltransferase
MDQMLEHNSITRHLDLGCGAKPRNPYHCSELFGCDIRASEVIGLENGIRYMQANLVLERLPFQDNYFDSISAFDFIEHIPRVLIKNDGDLTNPFVNLMSEIYRVLKPRGIFLAVTPAYPKPEAFQDPTHVNIITQKTHRYFLAPDPPARMYGFNGAFNVKTCKWGAPKNYFDLREGSLRKFYRSVEHLLFKGGFSHLIWELEAYKK